MKIGYQVIPHNQQRYPTVGDYWENGDTTHFRVSKMGDRRYEWLVFIHELIEYSLCKFRNVDLGTIDRFDTEYELARPSRWAPCGCKITDEPGDDIHAPYYREHQIATLVERTLAFFLGVNWKEYDNEVGNL